MEIKKVAMIGAGSMGGGMALLLGENGISVSIQDPSSETVDQLIKSAEEQGIHGKLSKHDDYKELCSSLQSPKVIFFSLPHGTVGDTVVEGLHKYLDKGDIIVDCSNEEWENTQRRQGKLVAQGVYYIGCGVSGGYQAARRGPSMCPGGEDQALDIVMPLFQKIAAKAKDGSPCVAKIGEGGAGHYVKMMHNGIEHGMMSAISEAWSIMNKHMRMSYDEISKVFEKWSSEGEFKDTFLVKIGADICAKKDEAGDKHVLGDVKDKVVQDIDGSEGTGIWSNTEATTLHIPAPTLITAHFLRIVSAFRGQREHVKETFHGSFPALQYEVKDEKEKDAFIEDLRQAVYATCLASYVQGISIIDAADHKNKWSINYGNIVQIWRAGCIIQADHINSLLAEIFHPESKSKHKNHNLLYEPSIVSEMKATFEPLKRVVLKGVELNAVIPSMSATLDYLKYSGNLDLPTQFYEAELDYFGKHMYDSKSEDKGPGAPETGKHHYEWKPA